MLISCPFGTMIRRVMLCPVAVRKCALRQDPPPTILSRLGAPALHSPVALATQARGQNLTLLAIGTAAIYWVTISPSCQCTRRPGRKRALQPLPYLLQAPACHVLLASALALTRTPLATGTTLVPWIPMLAACYSVLIQICLPGGLLPPQFRGVA